MKSLGTLSCAALVTIGLSLPVFAAAPPSATAAVGSDGTLIGGLGVTGAAHVDTGVYTVTFLNEGVPTACAYTAGIGSTDPNAPAPASLVNVGASATPGTIRVYTYDNHAQPADRPFEVYVAC